MTFSCQPITSRSRPGLPWRHWKGAWHAANSSWTRWGHTSHHFLMDFFSYWMVQHYFPLQASAGILARCHVSLCITVQRQLTVGSQMLHSHPSLARAAPQEMESSKVEITLQHPSFPTSKHCRTTLGCGAFIHLKAGITLSSDFEVYVKCIAGAVQCGILGSIPPWSQKINKIK